ncbi:hypothetical protein ACSBR1_040519 [Camellia fascicularis]
MERGGWIPALKHRGKPEAGRNMVSSEVYTVFVDNLPCSLDPKAQVAVQKGHGLWVDDKKLGVKFAEFERNREHGQTHIQPPKQSKYRVQVRRGPNPFTYNKSFAEVVKGTKVPSSGSVSIKAEVFGNGWLYDSVVVRLKASYVNISLKIELEERDLVIEPERLVWITCFGVPLHLWNRPNFVKIGSLWGEVLEGEEGIPQSLDCGKLRILTKCMDPINKVIHLETNQFSYPVRVLEDQSAVAKNFKQYCNCSTPQDVEEHHSSNEVRGSEEKIDFNRAAEPSQSHVDELTQHLGGESALGTAQNKLEARGKKPRGDVSVAAADKGELSKSVTAVAETCSMMGKELETIACKAMVAVSSAFNGTRAAGQGHDGQVYTPGFMRSLSGSSLKRPGLNLEVVLGHHKLNYDLVELDKEPNGPVLHDAHINDMAMDVRPVTRESSVSQTPTQVANQIPKSAAVKGKGKGQAKSKRMTSYTRPQKGLLGLDKRASLMGASTSKSVPIRSLFRASVAEASLLALTEKGGEGSQHILMRHKLVCRWESCWVWICWMLSWNIRGTGRQEKRGKIRNILKERNVDVAFFQETKKSVVADKDVRAMWARNKMEYTAVDSEGLAGGLLCIWDPEVFQLKDCCCTRRFILLSGTLFNSFDCVLLNIYAPNEVGNRAKLWDCLLKLKGEFPNPWCLCGDFNEIKSVGERKGCFRRDKGMREFNEFIEQCEVNDIPLLGRKYTWCNSITGDKWSRIDRVLVDPKWFEVFNLKLWGLPRLISDHCPLLLMEDERDWGPKPFRIINAWSLHPCFPAFVEKTWKGAEVEVGVAREFEKLQVAFLWGGSGSRKPIYLVKWDDLAKSVNQGAWA